VSGKQGTDAAGWYYRKDKKLLFLWGACDTAGIDLKSHPSLSNKHMSALRRCQDRLGAAGNGPGRRGRPTTATMGLRIDGTSPFGLVKIMKNIQPGGRRPSRAPEKRPPAAGD
jgi:hypothetical protein